MLAGMSSFKEKSNAALTYVRARLGEPSTWRGLVLVAIALGAHISDDQKDAIIEIGLWLAGVIGVVTPDKRQSG